MAKFKLGQLLMTNGIGAEMKKNPAFEKFVKNAFERYKNCDWGDMSAEDQALNNKAVEDGKDRIFAAYTDKKSIKKIWIITEQDRSATTVLFPFEY